ncbi:hypothetical protein VTK73DRAFT_4842 [Phialemonium thermophilum]|uniref:Uncharacterized protein n=1 Tax=Phialemonium thermophilum TaxID=223376 RepID=A0ABR3V5K2_9PEZI
MRVWASVKMGSRSAGREPFFWCSSTVDQSMGPRAWKGSALSSLSLLAPGQLSGLYLHSLGRQTKVVLGLDGKRMCGRRSTWGMCRRNAYPFLREARA